MDGGSTLLLSRVRASFLVLSEASRRWLDSRGRARASRLDFLKISIFFPFMLKFSECIRTGRPVGVVLFLGGRSQVRRIKEVGKLAQAAGLTSISHRPRHCFLGSFISILGDYMSEATPLISMRVGRLSDPLKTQMMLHSCCVPLAWSLLLKTRDRNGRLLSSLLNDLILIHHS